MTKKSNEKIGLEEAISSLRDEILSAMDKATREKLKFELLEVDLEFQVEIEKKREGKLDVKLAGVGGSVTKTTNSTVRLKLKPDFETENGKQSPKLLGKPPKKK